MSDMSNVFFKSVDRIGANETQVDQVTALFPHISPVQKGDIVAVKIHPGEYGNTTHIRPVIVRTVVDMVRDAGGIPFVTDTTTLYKGRKLNAADLIWAAAMNGFTQSSMNAPFIVADGLRGDDGVCVTLNGEYLDEITVASAIAKADSMIVISHCKGHPGSGFGGGIKNLGMGCLDKNSKTRVHEVGKPTIDPAKCIGCRICFNSCAWGALKLDGDEDKDKDVDKDGDECESEGTGGRTAYVDKNLCRGELACAASCPQKAIIPPADVGIRMQHLLGEAAMGPIKALDKRIGYINWVYDLTPGCDCFNFSAPAFSDNVGILASGDPVAIDAASIDLIDSTMAKHNNGCIQDVWGIDPIIHLESAKKLGCGTTRYSLIV